MQGIKYPPKFRAEVLQDYLSGMSFEQVAAKRGCAIMTCHKIVKESGVVSRPAFQIRQRTPQWQLEEMVEAYLSGETMKEAASRFNLSRNVVKKALTKGNFAVRPSSNDNKYIVNHTFFDEIDAEEKAYWMGFLAADGCIYKRVLTVSLSQRDGNHLHKMRDSLSSNYPITEKVCSGGYGSQSKISTLRISSDQLTDSLRKHGVTERKSLNLRPWIGPPDLTCHYWRGVLDGDGYISQAKTGKWVIGLCGSYDMMNGFREFCISYCGAKGAVHPMHNIFRFAVGGNAMPRKLAKILYENCSVAMERKHDLAKRLIGAD